VGVAAALIALVPVFWYAGQVLRPVRRMIESAHALARGAGDERLVASSAVPELREFASAFNHALDRNASLTAELQAANDHLAHELRTPLARIRGNLEVFHESVTEPAAQEAAARGMDEIDRASSLVQTILTVRAGEHNALKLHREETSLNDLIQDLIDLYDVSAEDKDMTLRFQEDAEVTFSLDQQRITQALANLLDNALAYTPVGGSIVVKLEGGEKTCTIRVQDSGPGIKDDEMHTIWQRFIRGSASSARTPGMGLGLSLVLAVAMAHGGEAGCLNRDGGGAEFWLTLPR
jgi:signal transduction histidine kinase